jgi:hypothetical protein
MDKLLTVAELEARMRPGAYSDKGFLGPDESLEEVIRRDEMTLRDMRITYEEIADAISRLLDDAVRQPYKPNGVGSRIPDLYNRLGTKSVPYFDQDHLPGADEGYSASHHQVFFVQFRGLQGCPWGCDSGGSRDFLILNRTTGEYFTGPSLIVHLIREHHFFEGTGTPFRTDPFKAARVLGLTR